MAFTSTDLANVEAAIVALAAGSRIVSVTVGDHTIQYSEARLDRLKALRDEIMAEIQSVAVTPRRHFVLTSTSKGVF